MRTLDILRAAGWTVAVHNDYRQDGKAMTFWLFTHPSGRWIKGEGPTDADALEQAAQAAKRDPAPHPEPWASAVADICAPLSEQSQAARTYWKTRLGNQ